MWEDVNGPDGPYFWPSLSILYAWVWHSFFVVILVFGEGV